jgi:hypothetical protein
MAPLLLTALQIQANAEGLAEVTVAHLAGTLGSSKRHIQRLLRLLETSGAITALRQAGGRGKPAQYQVTLSVPKDDLEVTLSTPNGDAPVTLSGQTTLFPPPLPPTPPYTPTSTPTTTRRPHTQAAEVYRSVGSEPPAPGVLNKWAKLLGGMDPLCTLLDELAAAGHLTTKGQAYVFGAVKNRAAGLSKPPAAAPALGGRGVVDPRRLAQAAALAGRRTGDNPS